MFFQFLTFLFFFYYFLTDSCLRFGVVITDSHDFHLLSVKSFCVQQVGDDGMFMPHLESGKSSEVKITLF